MKVSGTLRKMQSKLGDPIIYSLCLNDKTYPLNDIIGKKIQLTFSGNIYCIQCNRKITKSFQQGYCYPCYKHLLECNLCIIHPERCLIEKKPCPKESWAHAQCGQPHIIYLSNTSGLKVGITRESQIPTRWIDQGATQAVPLFKVHNRYRAGLIEVALKQFVADKTNWRVMLKNEVTPLDLLLLKNKLLQKAQLDEHELELIDEKPLELSYPVLEYPSKVSSLSFEKTPEISGKLLGIKGQYLIIDKGVLNLRKFGGYEVEVII